MAPELLQKGKMTRAADVYSFSMIMVELFTCKRLFEGLAQQQVRLPPQHAANMQHFLCFLA
jgi:serine/threonine protein kinase